MDRVALVRRSCLFVLVAGLHCSTVGPGPTGPTGTLSPDAGSDPDTPSKGGGPGGGPSPTAWDSGASSGSHDDAASGPSCTDTDGDGYSTCNGDCNDRDPNIHPGAVDVPSDTVDQDCTGKDRGTCPTCLIGRGFPLSLRYSASGCSGFNSASGVARGNVKIPEDAQCSGVLDHATFSATIVQDGLAQTMVDVVVQMDLHSGCGQIVSGSYVADNGFCSRVSGSAYLNGGPTCRAWTDDLLCPPTADGGASDGGDAGN